MNGGRRAGCGLFQFTPLREGLPESGMQLLLFCYFNSRPCERGFVVIPVHITVYSISIHAPARGASYVISSPPSASLFQFTPLREGLLMR